MLPRAHLQSRRDGEHVRPAWLEPRHDAWLRTVIEALDALVGRTVAEVDQHDTIIGEAARIVGVSGATASGVWRVLRRSTHSQVAAKVAPRILRAEIFEHAATNGVAAALERSCSRLAVEPEEMRSWLYADLPGARVVRWKQMPSAGDLRDAYNMYLAQGLLGRCSRIAVAADENLRAVVRAAKLRGLLVSVAADGNVVTASGPLALFRHTTKYANALAMFLPSLVSLPRWSLTGDIAFPDGIAKLSLTQSSPLPRTWELPQRTDSALERGLMKALARSKSGWSIRREGIVLRAGRELFFPDFLLERGSDRVVVEIVGFWTPDYLARKMSQLATVADVPLVVCVDETLACDPSRLSNADVVRFRRRLDADVLLAAAERVIASQRKGS